MLKHSQKNNVQWMKQNCKNFIWWELFNIQRNDNTKSCYNLMTQTSFITRWLILYISGNMMLKWGKVKDSDTNQITKIPANVHNILN